MKSSMMCYNGHAITDMRHFQPLKCPRCISLRRMQALQSKEHERDAKAEREYALDIKTLPDYLED